MQIQNLAWSFAVALALPCFAAAQTVLYQIEDVPAWEFGNDVDGGHDLDGDGYDDILVGVSDQAFSPQHARVYSGRTGLLMHDFELTGKSGMSVAFIGDLTGDGRPDVLVGNTDDDTNAVNAGCVHVYSGADGALHYALFGAAFSDSMGADVAPIGDIDGDGRADYLVGTSGFDVGAFTSNGKVSVHSGADGSVLFEHVGATDEYLGTSLSPAGDVDGDGVADYLVGSPIATSERAKVYSGADHSVLYDLVAPLTNSDFGEALAPLGDLDADGFDDFIVGAPRADPNGVNGGGEAIVYSGRTGTPIPGLTFQGTFTSDNLGESVARAGDLDRDGIVDILIGIPREDDFGPQSGQARIYSGADGSLLFSMFGDQTDDVLGFAVAFGGDVDRDGIADVVVGAPRGNVRGLVRVYSFCSGGAITEYGESCLAYQTIEPCATWVGGPGGCRPEPPTLTGEGCASPGGIVRMTVGGASGGVAILYLGSQRDLVSTFPNGCPQLISPFQQFVVLPLGGNGTAEFEYQLGPLITGTFTLQAVVFHSSYPGGNGSTNGLELVVQ